MSSPFLSSNPGGGEIVWRDGYATGQLVPVTPSAHFPVYDSGLGEWVEKTVLPPYPPGTAVEDQLADGTLYALAFDQITDATTGWPMLVRHGWEPKEWKTSMSLGLIFYADNPTPIDVSLGEGDPGIFFGFQPAIPPEDLAVFPGGDYESDPLPLDIYPGGSVSTDGRASFYPLPPIANDSGSIDAPLEGIDEPILKYWWKIRIGRALRSLNGKCFCEVELIFKGQVGTILETPDDPDYAGIFVPLVAYGTDGTDGTTLLFECRSDFRLLGLSPSDRNGRWKMRTSTGGTVYGGGALAGAVNGAPTITNVVVPDLTWEMSWSTIQPERPGF